MVPVLVTNTIKRMKIFGNRHSHCSLLLNIGFFFLAQQQVFHTCIVKIPRIDFFRKCGSDNRMRSIAQFSSFSSSLLSGLRNQIMRPRIKIRYCAELTCIIRCISKFQVDFPASKSRLIWLAATSSAVYNLIVQTKPLAERNSSSRRILSVARFTTPMVFPFKSL